MTLRKKLLLAFVGIGATISALSLLALNPLRRGVRDVGEFHGPALDHARSMHSDLLGAVQRSLAYVISGEERERESSLVCLARVEVSLVGLREVANLTDPEEAQEAALVERIERGREALLESIEGMHAVYERAGSVPRDVFDDHSLVVEQVLAAAEQLAAIEAGEARAAQVAALETIDFAEWMFYGIAAFAVLMAAGVGWYVTRNILRSIEHLQSAAEGLAAGNAEPVAIHGSTELASLGAAFNRMLGEVEVARETLESAVAERTSELSAANEALRTSELAQRTLTDYAPEAIVVLDVDSGTFVDMNPRALQLFKIDRDALFASNPTKLSPELQSDGRASESAARAFIGEALAGGAPRFEWEHMDTEGNVVPCEVCLVQIPSTTRRLVRGTIIDISEKHRAQERQRRVLHELDHRVKNNLAAVLALLDHTFGSATSMESFRVAYSGRIRAMASAHDALARRHWKGIEIQNALRAVLAPYGRERVTTHGSAVVLSPGVAAPLGLAMHELGTNAVKYGSLSVPDGRVRIRWTMAEDRIEIDWVECGGPKVEGPAGEGLGLKLLKGLIEYEVGGEVALHFEEPGFRCVLALPLTPLPLWDDALQPAEETHPPGPRAS